MISSELFKAFLKTYVDAGLRDKAEYILQQNPPFYIEETEEIQELAVWLNEVQQKQPATSFSPELFYAILVEYLRGDEFIKVQKIIANALPAGCENAAEEVQALIKRLKIVYSADAEPERFIGDPAHAMQIFRFAWVYQKLFTLRSHIKNLFSWGVGDAVFERFLAANQPLQITGFTPARSMKPILENWPGKKEYLGNLEVVSSYLDIDDKFDVGIALETIEHFDDQEADEVLSFMRNKCQVSFFSVPHGAVSLFPPVCTPWIAPFKFDHSRDSRHEHVRAFTPVVFKKFLEKHGFEVLSLVTAAPNYPKNSILLDQIVAMAVPTRT
jgi:hypothetical protein